MDIFDVVFHPFFYIPFFTILGLSAILASIFIKSLKIKKILTMAMVATVLLFMIPYVYAMLIWFLVNKLHWIR